MVRYIIERTINESYCHGTVTLMEDGKPKTFSTEKEALTWLVNNDEDFWNIPIVHLFDYFNIKPYII